MSDWWCSPPSALPAGEKIARADGGELPKTDGEPRAPEAGAEAPAEACGLFVALLATRLAGVSSVGSRLRQSRGNTNHTYGRQSRKDAPITRTG
eukprot:796892-Prorocentrum_minimum.AAC.1